MARVNAASSVNEGIPGFTFRSHTFIHRHNEQYGRAYLPLGYFSAACRALPQRSNHTYFLTTNR